MTRSHFISGLAMTALTGLTLAAVLRAVTGARWFDLYGCATVVLVTLPAVAHFLFARLKEAGRSRAWALLYIIPAALLALIQIGYWTAFFTYGPSDPTLGIVRATIHAQLGSVLPWLAAALLLVWAWLFTMTAGRRD